MSDLQNLLQKVKVQRYKSTPPGKLLMKVFDIVERKVHERKRAWNNVVELIAKYLVINEDLPLANMGTIKGFHGLSLKQDKLYKETLPILEAYVIAARDNPSDHLGELFEHYGLAGRHKNDVCLTPANICKFMVSLVLGDEEKMVEKFAMESWVSLETKKYLLDYYMYHGQMARHLPKFPIPRPKTVLEPCVGTGRFLIEINIMYPKAPLVLYAIELRLDLYRSCLVNMALYSKHPFTIICGNTLMLPVVHTSHPLWDLGNRWDPPSLQKYYDKASAKPPINKDSFSLKAFSELKT